MFKKHQKKEIFLDYASGTPIDSEVFSAMKPYFTDVFYNPSAIYSGGVVVRERLYEARKKVADVLKARPQEIIFTDGGTEANNLAIFGVVSAWQEQNPTTTPHVITSLIEHSSVLEACKSLEHNGCEVSYISVDEQGRVNLQELKESIKENTVLVSVGYVNGEIGVIQDVKAIAKTVRHYRKHHDSIYPYFHTDAVQAVNYLPVTVPQLGIDLMTINGSKIYGPKKIAILYVKTGTDIKPMIVGGDQEMNMRAGTENIPYIVGMEAALEKTSALLESENERLTAIQSQTIKLIKEQIPNAIINGEESDRIPNIINISIPKLSSEEIVLRLDAKGIKASVKSACKSGEDGDSHVIQAIATGNRPTSSIRLSMGRNTSQKEMNKVIQSLAEIVQNMTETYEKYYAEV